MTFFHNYIKKVVKAYREIPKFNLVPCHSKSIMPEYKCIYIFIYMKSCLSKVWKSWNKPGKVREFYWKSQKLFLYILFIRNNTFLGQNIHCTHLNSKSCRVKMSGNFWKFCLENLEKSGTNIPAKFEQPLKYSILRSTVVDNFSEKLPYSLLIIKN